MREKRGIGQLGRGTNGKGLGVGWRMLLHACGERIMKEFPSFQHAIAKFTHIISAAGGKVQSEIGTHPKIVNIHHSRTLKTEPHK
jgi:hypothetical protein